MTAMVDIRAVSRHFGDMRAVDTVSFDLERGQFLTIVGPSGCGKTTLLRMIAGFDRPSAGEIRVNGARIERVPAWQRSIGMVFQGLALFPHMTAAQNVAYPLRMRGFERARIPEIVHEHLALVRLDGLGARRPHELSGGQRQRVAIARALSFSPDLLLLDEPLSALDRKLREDMQLEFRRIQEELGVTTINVTHDQREALVMSDRIVVMDQGRLQQDDSPIDTYRNPGNRFVASFIGTTSLLDGWRVQSMPDAIAPAAPGPVSAAASVGSQVTDDSRHIAVRIGDRVLSARTPGAAVPEGAAVDCALRAEQVRIVSDGEPSAATDPGAPSTSFDNIVDGTVAHAIFEGDRLLYVVDVPELGGLAIHVSTHDAMALRQHRRGERVRLGWNAVDLLAYPTDTTHDKE